MLFVGLIARVASIQETFAWLGRIAEGGHSECACQVAKYAA